MKTPNRHKAEVALPGSPGGRFIRFTYSASCRMKSLYPENWLKSINDGLDAGDPEVIGACIENAIVGEEPFDVGAYWDSVDAIDDIIAAVRGALLLTFTGKTQDELIAEQAKKKTDAMVAMGMDPEMVERLISLNDAGLLDMAPASSQPNSTTSAE